MHMQRNWVSGVLFSLIFSLLLTGCGSGGDGDPPVIPPIITGTPEGSWSGTTNNGRTAWGVVLDDGSFWFLYSAVGDPGTLRGAFQGTTQSQNGAFTASETRDFSTDEHTRFHGGMSGSYVPQQSLSGTATVTWDGSETFTTTFTTAYQSKYEDVPDLTQLVGTYPGGPYGEGSVQAPAVITVSPDGSFSITNDRGGRYSGWTATPCFNSTGTLTPRAQGNVYDLTIPKLCGASSLTDTYAGVATFDSATNMLSLLALDGDRSSAFLYRGTKQ